VDRYIFGGSIKRVPVFMSDAKSQQTEEINQPVLLGLDSVN
jgi:hypothetical protein